MSPHELDADQLLGALGDLQRAERAELSHLEEPARRLADREPERAHAFQARLMRELCGAAAAPPPRVRRLGRVFSYAAASCAMAAAALLWVRAPAPFAVAYTLVPPAPDAATRSPAAAPLPAAGGSYSLGRTLTFTLRPDVRYSGALRVLAYVAPLNGRGDDHHRLTRLEPKVELDPAGGAHVIVATGPNEQLASDGSWELRFYVSPADVAAVSDAELQARSCPEATRCLAFTARLH